MRKIFLTLCCLTQLLGAEPLPTYTLPLRPPDAERPVLVEDKPELGFRTAAMLAQAYKGNTTGLAELKMSGSAEFQSLGLAQLVQQIPASQNIVMVDLRQESHALLDDRLVTWEAGDNWANVGMDHDRAVSTEEERIAAITPNQSVGMVSERQYKAGQKSSGEAHRVQVVLSEKALVEGAGLEYERLTVTDHLRPSDQEVDRYLRFYGGLSSDQWVHFHCRAGVGRTAVFMAMHDMLHNADRVPLQEILARQGAVPPGHDLNLVEEGPRHPFYLERHLFLSWFHRYAQARLAGNRQSWSEWIADQSPS